MSFRQLFEWKKEFPNVTHKLISLPQAKNFFGKNTVAETSSRDEEKTVTETGKLVVYLQKKWKDNCLSDGKFCCFPPKKYVSVTDIWGILFFFFTTCYYLFLPLNLPYKWPYWLWKSLNIFRPSNLFFTRHTSPFLGRDTGF